MLSLKLFRPLALAVAIFSTLATVSPQSTPIGREDVIGQARRTYYSATRHGFNGFQATIEPNWKVVLGNTATSENLKVFRALRFALTVDGSGAATISHQVADPQRIKAEAYVQQIHDHMQRLVERFFRTWALFMISSPFQETEIKIEAFGSEYRVLYAVQSAEVMITMLPDLRIKELRVTDPTSKRIINPVFRETSEGLLLTGYHTVFEPVSEVGKTTLDVDIEYQAESGIKLPHRIRISGMYGGEAIAAEISFNRVSCEF